MKFRTTYEDVVRMSLCRSIVPTSCSDVLQIPVMQVAPRPEDSMAHRSVSQPLQDSDFNQLSISDVHSFRQFKDMDSMHKADSIARYVERGKKLSQTLKKEGSSKFVGRYSVDK